MAKKIQSSKSNTEVINITAANRSKLIEDIKKIDKAVNYGEIPLKTYEIMRNKFVGIK